MSTEIAKAFYSAMREKNIAEVEKYLHEDIEFNAPLAKAKGKKAYHEVLKGFISFFETLTIRGQFGTGQQAVVIYDVEIPTIGKIPTASVMTFQDGLISKVELIYDARPFEKKHA